jgi:uncharacterized membrane protein YphA (DoxX/SURF4 family)
MSKGPLIISWVLAVLLGAMFLAAGAGKFGEDAGPMFAAWGYAPWFAVFVGACEVLGGIGLLVPRTTRLAVMGLTPIMLGAAYTHVANGEGMDILRPIVFLVLLWVLWWLRRPRGAVSA